MQEAKQLVICIYILKSKECVSGSTTLKTCLIDAEIKQICIRTNKRKSERYVARLFVHRFLINESWSLYVGQWNRFSKSFLFQFSDATNLL